MPEYKLFYRQGSDIDVIPFFLWKITENNRYLLKNEDDSELALLDFNTTVDDTEWRG